MNNDGGSSKVYGVEASVLDYINYQGCGMGEETCISIHCCIAHTTIYTIHFLNRGLLYYDYNSDFLSLF